MPAMPFSPCSSAVSGAACPDQTVQILTDIFGPVITTLTQGGDPNSQQMAANIIATMFNAFNTGLLAVAGIIVGYVALMGVANTANDGEAFGKAWSTWWTPARIIYGGGMMLPTTSGYSVAQIVVFTVALWSIGLANTIYTAAFSMSVVAPSGLISGINQPGAFFGMRDFAKNYLEASYCAHAANAIYNPASGGSGSAVNFENYSMLGQADYTGTASGYSNAVTKIMDRGPGFVDGNQGACGIVTLSSYTAQTQNEQSNSNSGTTTTSTDPMGQALENMHQAAQGYKVQAAKTLMQNLDSWVATWPNTANDTGWSNVNSSQFNTYVSAAENQVATQLAQTAQSTSSTTNNGLQDYVQAMTAGGWATAGGWFQRVGQLRGQFTGVMTDPVGSVTPPTINEFPTGDAGTPELDNSIEAVINAINQKADVHATTCSNSSSSNCGGVTSADLDLSGALPKSVKDMSVASIKASLDNKVSTWLNSQMSTLVSIVTGANTQGVTNANNSSAICGTAGQLGGSLNRMKCVGDYLTVIHGTMIASDGALKVGLTTVRVAADALSTEVLGNRLDTADMGTAVWDLYIQWLAPLIGGVIAKTGHLAFLFGVFLPSLPYLLFMMVVAGWILSVMMTGLAVPLWMCMHMTPERTFVGSQSQGYLLLLSLFARPSLAVIGLIAAFKVSDPIISYISTGFFAMRAAVVSSTGVIGWFAQFESFVWWFEMYGFVLIPVLYMIFGLPQALPGHVLEWIGGGVRDLGETGAQHSIRGGYDTMSMRGKLMPGMGGVGALTAQGGPQGGGAPRLGGGGNQSPGGSIGGGSGGGAGPGAAAGGGSRQSAPVNVGPQGVTSSVNAGADGYNPPGQASTSGAQRNQGSVSDGVGTAFGRGLVLGGMAAGRSAARMAGAKPNLGAVGSAIRESASDVGGAFKQAGQDGQAAMRDGVGATLQNIRTGNSGGATPASGATGSPTGGGPASGSPPASAAPAPTAAPSAPGRSAQAEGSVRPASAPSSPSGTTASPPKRPESSN